jgi:hypothetical protein
VIAEITGTLLQNKIASKSRRKNMLVCQLFGWHAAKDTGAHVVPLGNLREIV